MSPSARFVNASLLPSTGSLLVALVSVILGRRVSYLDHLAAFNSMAMLALGVAALVVGLVETWKSRGRSASAWLADLLAVVVVGLYVFNP